MKDIRINILKNMLRMSNVDIHTDGNNNIIIDGNVIIYDDTYDKFPVKIHKVNGNISWKGFVDGTKPGSLSSLENFPDIVNGSVFIDKNPMLISLKGAPKEITGTFTCHHGRLNDISDLPKKIGNNLDISNNPIDDISVLEKVFVGGNINISGTNYSKNNNSDNIKTLNDSSIIYSNDIQNSIFD